MVDPSPALAVHLRLPQESVPPVDIILHHDRREYVLCRHGLSWTASVTKQEEASTPDIHKLMRTMYERLAYDWVRKYYWTLLTERDDISLWRCERGLGETVWVQITGMSLLLMFNEGDVVADRLESLGRARDSRIIRTAVEGARQWDAQRGASEPF